MQRLGTEVGRGEREGSPSGSGPCAQMGPLSASIWGSPSEPRGRAHPGLVPVEPPQRGGARQPPPGSDTVLGPGWAPKSGSAHQLSPVISSSPLGFSFFKGTNGLNHPTHLLVLRIRNRASIPADTLITPAGGQVLLKGLRIV